MIRSLTLAYDDSVLLEASLSRDEFEREAKLLLAAKLFERRAIVFGQGSRAWASTSRSSHIDQPFIE